MRKKLITTLMSNSARWTLLGGLASASLLLADDTSAQNCNAESCSAAFEFEQLPEIQPMNGIFKFQARISQAKMPVGEAEFARVIVNLLKPGAAEPIASEVLEKVQVRDSILNLRIGSKMGDLKTHIAQYSDLSFQVCLNDETNCLKSVELASVPYSIKSEYALSTQYAQKSQVAAQCHYTHRASADANMFTTNAVGVGYYDFHSPTNAGLLGIEPTSQNVGDGYLQWTAVGASEKNLNICAKNPTTGALVTLDELRLHATQTRLKGALEVDAETLLSSTLRTIGATTLENTLDVAGNTHLFSALVVDSSTDLHSTLDVDGNTHLFSELDVNGAARLHNILNVAGNTQLQSELDVGMAARFAATLNVTGNAQLQSDLDVGQAARFGGTLNVTGVTTLQSSLSVANGVNVAAGGLSVNGSTNLSDVTASQGLSVTGGSVSTSAGVETVFYGPVRFEGGTTDANAPDYLLQTEFDSAIANYLLANDISATYATKSELASALSTGQASIDSLQLALDDHISDSAATYATKSELSSFQSTVASTYATKTSVDGLALQCSRNFANFTSTQTERTLDCSSGWKATGGGHALFCGTDAVIRGSFPTSDEQGWTVRLDKSTGGTNCAQVFVECCRIN